MDYCLIQPVSREVFMKNGKKILATMLAGLMASISAMGLVACQPDDNSSSTTDTSQFRDIYARYLVYAQAQGIEPVSYEEWLASIKGEQGISVTDVKITYDYNKLGETVMVFTFYMSDESTITKEVVVENYDETASEGFAYERSEDRLSFVITDMGGCKDVDIVIPSVHEQKPVTAIDMIAFAQNKSLKSVMIGRNVTTIGEMAFFACSGLVTVVIPESVTLIEEAAFSYCTSLANIIVDENNANYASADNDLYTKDGKTLVHYAISKKATQFAIPDEVTSIGGYAFAGSSLTSVVIGKGVTSIGARAFVDCKKLTSVYYQGTLEDWAKISIKTSGNGNAPLMSAIRYYYSETEPAVDGNYWHYDENGEVAVWPKKTA